MSGKWHRGNVINATKVQFTLSFGLKFIEQSVVGTSLLLQVTHIIRLLTLSPCIQGLNSSSVCAQEHTSQADIHPLYESSQRFLLGKKILFSLLPLAPTPQNLHPQLLYAGML